MKWLTILAGLTLGALLLGASWFVTAGDTTFHDCSGCHLRRDQQTTLGISTTRDVPDARTAWVERHVSTPHEHHWVWGGTDCDINLWGAVLRRACGSRELTAGPEFVPILRRLEPLGLDLLY